MQNAIAFSEGVALVVATNISYLIGMAVSAKIIYAVSVDTGMIVLLCNLIGRRASKVGKGAKSVTKQTKNGSDIHLERSCHMSSMLSRFSSCQRFVVIGRRRGAAPRR